MGIMGTKYNSHIHVIGLVLNKTRLINVYTDKIKIPLNNCSSAIAHDLQ